MGFEEAVPPVPDRMAEIQMLDRLEQTWLDQPYNRYYMQEDLRQTKMEYAQYNLKVSRFLRRPVRSFFWIASSSASSPSPLLTSLAGFTLIPRSEAEEFPSPKSKDIKHIDWPTSSVKEVLLLTAIKLPIRLLWLLTWWAQAFFPSTSPTGTSALTKITIPSPRSRRCCDH